MPELPEVETIVRELKEAGLKGLSIVNAVVFWHRSIANQRPADFCQSLIKQNIRDIYRRGKFIVFLLTSRILLVHLRMTGKFFIDKEEAFPHSHERVRLYLSDGRILRYEDQRKFGKWTLTKTEEILDKIGIEPLSSVFTFKQFEKILTGRHRKIKPFLLDQQHIAGIGNIYADEALWAAKIHPKRMISSLTIKEKKNLHKAIIDVLKKGIENAGTSLGEARANYSNLTGGRGKNQGTLKVFQRHTLPCPRCRTTIQKSVLAQRGTYFCPYCQKL